MAQSWIHLARDLAPQVPELPAVIEQEVSTLSSQELTEELLTQMARSITRRVEEAGHQELAASLLRRMGRAIYELLLLLATEEELRAMGMLVQAAQAAPPPVAGWTAPPPPSTPLFPAQDPAPAPAPASVPPPPTAPTTSQGGDEIRRFVPTRAAPTKQEAASPEPMGPAAPSTPQLPREASAGTRPSNQAVPSPRSEGQPVPAKPAEVRSGQLPPGERSVASQLGPASVRPTAGSEERPPRPGSGRAPEPTKPTSPRTDAARASLPTPSEPSRPANAAPAKQGPRPGQPAFGAPLPAATAPLASSPPSPPSLAPANETSAKLGPRLVQAAPGAPPPAATAPPASPTPAPPSRDRSAPADPTSGGSASEEVVKPEADASPDPVSGVASGTELPGVAAAAPAPAGDPPVAAATVPAAPAGAGAGPEAEAGVSPAPSPPSPPAAEPHRESRFKAALAFAAGRTAKAPSTPPTVEATTEIKEAPPAPLPPGPPSPEPAIGPDGDLAVASSEEVNGALSESPEASGEATVPPPLEPLVPARPTTGRSGPDEEDVALWGFDPAARDGSDSEPAPEALPATVRPAPESEPAIAVAATAVAAGAVPAMAAAAVPGLRLRPNHGWSVRLSPKAAVEQDRRLKQRQAELPALLAEIVEQVHQQRRAVSDRGLSKQAVRSAAEQTAPADLPSASAAVSAFLEASRLADAAAMALRVTEAFPGEASAELACRVGEACRQAKDGDLAALCFTTAVLAAPPCEPACWQLAGMALEQRDARLAPAWMEFLARLLRVRGADEDAIVVYRQLLNLAPRRQDVRDVLRVASLTGTLPD